MARWNPAAHPRYPNGKFRPKLSQSVRLSPISVSYNAGARVPIVPGRASLYVGALVRVERTGGRSRGLFQRKVDSAVDGVAGRLGDRGGQSNVARLLKGQEINTKSGLRVSGPRNVVNTPTFRVSSTPASREKGLELRERPATRAPRRRVRNRGTNLALALSEHKRAPSPSLVVPKGPRRVTKKASARGRRVKR